jgi:hypothetical protein
MYYLKPSFWTLCLFDLRSLSVYSYAHFRFPHAQPGSSTSARKLSALAAALPRDSEGTNNGDGGDDKWHASLRALTRYYFSMHLEFFSFQLLICLL